MPDFSLCSKLEQLELHENYLEGPIPPGLAACTKLSSLTLVKNCLTGE